MNAALIRRPLFALPPSARLGWSLALAGAALLTGLAALPPWLPAEAGALIYQGYALLCHQLPERSAHAHGVPFALCHRCFGIASGLVVGVLATPLVVSMAPEVGEALGRRAGWVVGLALAPLAVDWALGASGVWANTPLSRTLTGALFGLAAGAALAVAVGCEGAVQRAGGCIVGPAFLSSNPRSGPCPTRCLPSSSARSC